MFNNFYLDNRILYVLLAVLVIMSLMGMTQDSLLGIVLTLPGVIIAITFHEYAHAFMADRLGDSTPRMQGRLTLNPMKHLDPFGIILLVFAHIGWGKPVQINPRNFNSNVTLAKAEALVSLAGPVMNFIIAIVLTIVYFFIQRFAPTFFLTQIGIIVYLLLNSTIAVNIGLGVFNLIPLPPLDGSKIFKNILPYKARYWLESNERILYIIFLVLWITGLLGYIVSPVIDGISSGLYWIIAKIFGFI